MAPTFVRLIGDLARTTGVPVADDALAGVAAELERVGMSDDPHVPSYFFDALRRMIAHGTSPWVVLPPHEVGDGWVLGKLTVAVPGAWHDELPDRDVFGVPALKRAVVVARAGDGERYAVVELAASGRPLEPPPRTGPTILGTLVPTDDQLRRWAYDPDMRLHTQDEELALDAAPVPLLIQLARDPACPRRARARGAILAQGLRQMLIDGESALPHMAEVGRLLKSSGDPGLHADSASVVTLSEYLAGHGPVELETARVIARLLLAGIADLVIEARKLDGWWELTTPERGPEWIYVQAASGALVYRRGQPIDVAELAALGTPRARSSALGRTPRAG